MASLCLSSFGAGGGKKIHTDIIAVNGIGLHIILDDVAVLLTVMQGMNADIMPFSAQLMRKSDFTVWVKRAEEIHSALLMRRNRAMR